MTYKFETTPARSKIMRKIKSIETKPEISFRRVLWARGIRYRKNNRNLSGKPDISIKKYKILIFIDGEFWHGHNWEKKKGRIKANRDYWIPKIESNIERDRKNTLNLKKEGWSVLRFWESEINKKPEECVNKVLLLINKKRQK